MKKVLVTGAGGNVGLQVIRFLLSEGKYEITALELKDKYVYKRLKRFRKRINIVFGDVTDAALIDALIKENDYVIHLAGVLPHLANIRDDLCKEIDVKGTMQIVDSIKDYHPDCRLVYASSTSIYGPNDGKPLTVKSPESLAENDFYSKYKLMAEEYIKRNIKNYCILRLAYVLADPDKESLIYNVANGDDMEFISTQDAGYAFVQALEKQKETNKKTYNISGGDSYKDTYYNLALNVLSNYGITWKFIGSWFLADKNYYGGIYKDGEASNELLNYRSKNIGVYYRSLKKYKKSFRRFFPRVFAFPFILYYKRKLKRR